MKNYHLTSNGPNWALAAQGAERATKVFTGTKQEAVQQTAKIMQAMPTPASVKIHKVDGRIQEERTYPGSADPKSSKG